VFAPFECLNWYTSARACLCPARQLRPSSFCKNVCAGDPCCDHGPGRRRLAELHGKKAKRSINTQLRSSGPRFSAALLLAFCTRKAKALCRFCSMIDKIDAVCQLGCVTKGVSSSQSRATLHFLTYTYNVML